MTRLHKDYCLIEIEDRPRELENRVVEKMNANLGESSFE